MLDLLLPQSTKRVVVYLTPISARLDHDRLKALCRDARGIEPDDTTAFIFTNKERDTLLMNGIDDVGDRVLLKKLDKGAFLLPAPDDTKKSFATLNPSMLHKLFR